MATIARVFIFFLIGIYTAVDSFDCVSYRDYYGKYHEEQECGRFDYCCGSCDNRYCCSSISNILNHLQCKHTMSMGSSFSIAISIIPIFVLIIIIVSCCTCPCCCLYKMCRKPQRPIVTSTTTTTVMQVPYPQQPVGPQSYQGAQYPGYQPVPVQPGYGGQPMPTAPYLGQQYAPTYPGQALGPPPSYQEVVPGGTGAPAYPPGQPSYNPAHPPATAAYTSGQPAYPMQPPPQPGYPPQQGYPHQPDSSSAQPAYNPAYVEPLKSGY
ncbi:protein shisa-5 isoform X1 [Amia ocellicauda]|uniref:protein shisa-5 isoform X1 n=1 Tax=Amia ocellicauda TaxID=2972642 RepID=UPI003463AC78